MDSIPFYDSDPEGYSAKTFGSDMSPTRDRFTSFLQPGCRILDLGCGSGRDSLAFVQQGFEVTPVDGSEGMCRVAERNTGLNVRNLRFQDLDYDSEFDAVWAFASLLHVPSAELPSILEMVRRALRPSGILLMSFKEGNFEGPRDGRHYTDLTPDALEQLALRCGFLPLDVWTSLDGSTGIRWSNIIARS